MDGLRNGSAPLAIRDQDADSGNMSSTLSGALNKLVKTLGDKSAESDDAATATDTEDATGPQDDSHRDMMEGLMLENERMTLESQKQELKIKVRLHIGNISLSNMSCRIFRITYYLLIDVCTRRLLKRFWQSEYHDKPLRLMSDETVLKVEVGLHVAMIVPLSTSMHTRNFLQVATELRSCRQR